MPSLFTRPGATVVSATQSFHAPWWPALALLAIGSLAGIHLLAIPVFEDEGSQLRWIRRIIGAGEWLGPLRDGKPLEAWPMVPFVWLGMPAIRVMRALHVLAGAAGSVFVYRIALRLLDWRAAFVAGSFFAICPFVIYLQRFALSDSFLCLCALATLLGVLGLLERSRWSDIVLLGAGLALGALAKLPVGFVLMIVAPLALLLMPRGVRQMLPRHTSARLVVAYVPVVMLAVLVIIVAVVRVRRGQDPGFGLSDFAGLGLGQYQDIDSVIGVARATLSGELAAQLSWPVMLIGAAGIAASLYFCDWQSRWLLGFAAIPLLAVGALASFWFSRYLLFTLPSLIICAVAGWSAVTHYARHSDYRALRACALPLLAVVWAACLSLWGRQSALIIFDPLAARWSPVDRFQYFEGWGSGYGYPEAAAFLLSSPQTPRRIFALDGHSAGQMASYLPRAWIDRVGTVSYGSDGTVLRSERERLDSLLQDEPVWIVIPEPLLRRYLEASFGAGNPLDLRPIAVFDKPGARTRLALYEARRRSVQEPSHE